MKMSAVCSSIRTCIIVIAWYSLCILEVATMVWSFDCQANGTPAANTTYPVVDLVSTSPAPSASVNTCMSYAGMQEIVWLRGLLAELDFRLSEPTPFFLDSQSAEGLALNSVYHKRSKHIEIKYHWVREHADPDGEFRIAPTESNTTQHSTMYILHQVHYDVACKHSRFSTKAS